MVWRKEAVTFSTAHGSNLKQFLTLVEYLAENNFLDLNIQNAMIDAEKVHSWCKDQVKEWINYHGDFSDAMHSYKQAISGGHARI